MTVNKLTLPAKENAVQNKINEIIDNLGTSITVDQTYNGTSTNPQSGVAIAGELSTNYQPKLVSGTSIKTINNTSLLGSGDISVGTVTSVNNVSPVSGNVTLSIPTQASILEAVYPVGSIYMSVNNVSPATLFGFGTWEQIKDTFLLACGDTYSNADTGGASTVTLTTDQIPSHNHSASSDSTGAHTHARGTFEITGSVNFRNDQGKYQRATGSGAFSGTSSGTVARPDGGADVGESSYSRTASFKASDNWSGSTQSKGDHTHTITVNNNGGGQAHNNMPPYLAVNIWKRTA